MERKSKTYCLVVFSKFVSLFSFFIALGNMSDLGAVQR